MAATTARSIRAKDGWISVVVASDLLDKGFLHAELIDAGPKDPVRPIDVIRFCGVRESPVGIIHLQHQVHPTLQVQSELNRTAISSIVGIQVAKRNSHHDEDGDQSTSNGLEHVARAANQSRKKGARRHSPESP